MAEDPLEQSPVRAFLAIPLGDIFAREIERALFLLRPKIPGVKWIEPPQFHLTLHFFGSIPSANIARIDASMAGIAPRFAPLVLSLDRLGGFPNLERPNILWLGVEKMAPGIVLFQKAVAEELEKLGFEIEKRPYHPHATIGRVKKQLRDTPKVLAGIPLGLPTAEKTADHFVLYRSHTLPEGAHYEVLKNYLLSKKA